MITKSMIMVKDMIIRDMIMRDMNMRNMVEVPLTKHLKKNHRTMLNTLLWTL